MLLVPKCVIAREQRVLNILQCSGQRDPTGINALHVHVTDSYSIC